MNRFQERGIEFQEYANTVPEAVKAMNRSCEICNTNRCSYCPILAAHKFRIETLTILSTIRNKPTP